MRSIVTAFIAFTACTTVLAGCTSGPIRPAKDTQVPQLADADQVKALYGKFRQSLRDRDRDTFLLLVCPQRTGDIAVDAWFDDADELGDFAQYKKITKPSGDKAEEEGRQNGVTAWAQAVDSNGNHLQVAKIDNQWFVCEK